VAVAEKLLSEPIVEARVALATTYAPARRASILQKQLRYQ